MLVVPTRAGEAVKAIALILLAAGCSLDPASAYPGDITCDWQPYPEEGVRIPDGECWMVISNGDALLSVGSASACEEGHSCVTATGGQFVTPHAPRFRVVDTGEFQVEAIDCDALATACDNAEFLEPSLHR